MKQVLELEAGEGGIKWIQRKERAQDAKIKHIRNRMQ
jgi:hypothetical protein